MPRYASRDQAARNFQVNPRTIENWIGRGYIKGYKIAPRSIVVDLDEIERFLASVPPSVARDGRRLYGDKAQIIDLSNVVTEVEQ